jgi:dTDP-glucose 4,6-dehydratase|tara:strand:- start:1881 stop:2711 length:831 start_codon:yes stop_codon:yes gene_type:complete
MDGITLLIGGNGLIGRRLRLLLEEAGKDVLILEGVLQEDKNIIPPGTTEVIFLAQTSNTNVPYMTENLLFVNTILPELVAQEAAKAGVLNFAYFSTGSVYTASMTSHKEEEDSLQTGLPHYATTKSAAEILLNKWGKSFKRFVIFRPFFTYGPDQNPDRLIPSMFRRVMNRENIYLKNGKGLILNPIHVNDAARFICCALRFKKGIDIYNIAGSEIISLLEIVNKISFLVGREPCLVEQTGKEDVIVGNICKMMSVGFKHKVSLNEGLKDVLRRLL